MNCAQWTLCSIKQIIATTRSETQELPLFYGGDKVEIKRGRDGWRNGGGEKKKGACLKRIGMHVNCLSDKNLFRIVLYELL